MQVFVIHFSTVFDLSTMLNLPIDNPFFFLSRSWLHDAKNRMRFLKMHYAYNLIVTEKSMTSITFFEFFFDA